MQRYAVLQEKMQDIDADVLQRILIEDAGLPLPDAKRIARRSRGILYDRLNLQQAAAICGQLKQLGYAVRAVPADRLVALRRPRPVRWLELADDYLGLPQGYLGEVQRISWPSVFVINAGQISEVVDVGADKTDFEHEFSELSVSVDLKRQRSERIHVTDLIAVADDGQFQYIRLFFRDFNYERALGATSEGTQFDRYLLLLDELVRRSTSALVSPETGHVLRDRKQHYSSTDGTTAALAEQRDFADYSRWLLQLVLFAEAAKIDE